MDAVLNGELKKGDVVVIRYEGPKGGPGMREMLAITGAIKGAGIGKDVVVVGNTGYFEVWDAKRYDEQDDEVDLGLLFKKS